ncbi:hypothetical protein ACQEVC_10270 [Plantactinospora sp. CA-294935]|uniref:hypothetical protein n=1 Tax=Plantactinospora sp. CA-294935 TaxID=3240012 RepID=UPI002983C87E|nr:hypothetical protein [Plantactinospora sp. KLBMP9567]
MATARGGAGTGEYADLTGVAVVHAGGGDADPAAGGLTGPVAPPALPGRWELPGATTVGRS